METSEFLTLGSAARALGIARLTLRRRINRGQLQTFRNPTDDRTRLVRVTDVEAFRRPTPAPPVRHHRGGSPSMAS